MTSLIQSLIHIGEVVVGVILAFVLMFWTKGWFIILVLVLAGCGVARYSATTEANYTISPDGKTIAYKSNKEFERVIVELVEKEGQVTSVKIHIDEAKTSDQAIAAALANQLKLAEILEKLMPLIAKGAMSGS